MKNLMAAIFALLCVSCGVQSSNSNIDSRTKYWEAEIKTSLPIGSTREEAEKFFSARNAVLECCTTYPTKNISDAGSVRDKQSNGGTAKLPMQLEIIVQFKEDKFSGFDFINMVVEQ